MWSSRSLSCRKRIGCRQIFFASSTNRYEANADATVKLSKRWSTSLLAHYENETKSHDSMMMVLWIFRVWSSITSGTDGRIWAIIMYFRQV